MLAVTNLKRSTSGVFCSAVPSRSSATRGIEYGGRDMRLADIKAVVHTVILA
jgi:hypothetical protein